MPTKPALCTLNLKHISNRNKGAFPTYSRGGKNFEQPFVLNQNETSEMIDKTFNTSLSLNYGGDEINFSSQYTSLCAKL